MPTKQTAVEEQVSSTPGTRQFEPKFMRIGVLTAALQELTPREIRDADPDRAVEEWLEYAHDLGADYIELSAALHPAESDVPQEAMLDPVANTLDLRKPFNSSSARTTTSVFPTSPTSTTCSMTIRRSARRSMTS